MCSSDAGVRDRPHAGTWDDTNRHGHEGHDRRKRTNAGEREVELDIFSGMPNPTWVLTDAEAESFMRQVSALRQIPTKTLSSNLGYRGFIVHTTRGSDKQLIYVQSGIALILEGEKKTSATDEGRKLERWLLNSGKPHLKSDVFGLVEHQLR